jgi:hypothetical protein
VVSLEVWNEYRLVVVNQVEVKDLCCLFIEIVQNQHTIMYLHSNVVANWKVDGLLVGMNLGWIKAEH